MLAIITKLTNKDSQMLGTEGNGSAYVALKYYDRSHECFSLWHNDELLAFSKFCEALNQRSWNDIYKSGGKRNKTGLGYTIHHI